MSSNDGFINRVAWTDRFLRRLRRLLVGDPTGAAGAQVSIIHAGDSGMPSERLIRLALAAATHAMDEDLSVISDRSPTEPRWPDIWPGEHYRFLAGLVHVLQPRTVVEVGTYRGLSSLALAHRLPPGGRVVTFDVSPWREVGGQCLRDADLADGRIVPVCADLTESEVFEAHRDTLESASLMFIDAAKDGSMEQRLLDRMETLRCREPLVVVFDDIRMWNMLAIWRGIARPRFDAVSLGHWSGTGMVEWQAPER